jgi:hypothetical protein
MADMSDSPSISIPKHRGDNTFLPDKQFEKLYWSSWRKLLTGLIEDGLVPQPVIDVTYKHRLEYAKDLPKSGFIWVFKRTDILLGKKIIVGLPISPEMSLRR